LTHNKLVYPLGANASMPIGENRSRNATVRVLTDGHTHRLTDTNRFYHLSHSICYSYDTDNKTNMCQSQM